MPDSKRRQEHENMYGAENYKTMMSLERALQRERNADNQDLNKTDDLVNAIDSIKTYSLQYVAKQNELLMTTDPNKKNVIKAEINNLKNKINTAAANVKKVNKTTAEKNEQARIRMQNKRLRDVQAAKS